MRTNEDRIESAGIALKARCTTEGDGSDDENVIDLLTDLIHFCDHNKIDFDYTLKTARDHHYFETEHLE
jgi:hypothetical protein